MRRPKLSQRFLQRLRAVGAHRGAAGAAVAATVRALASGSLPGPADDETLIPPVLRVWFRRVPGHNLWLLFTFDDKNVLIRTIVSQPPVPID